jgi:hypothetical protein
MFEKKALGQAIAGVLLLSGASAVSAAQFLFDPDPAASIAEAACVVPGDGNTGSATCIDGPTLTDTFFWSAVNNGLDTQTAFGTQEWGLKIDMGAAGGAGIDNDDTFTEAFTFNLLISSPTDQSSDANKGYAGPSNFSLDPLNSHVYMTFSGSGTVQDVANAGADADAIEFSLDYDVADFQLFLDPDAGTHDPGTDTLLATFGANVGAGSISSLFTQTSNLNTLEWFVSFDTVLDGVFETTGGSPIHDGGATNADGTNNVKDGFVMFTSAAVTRSFNETLTAASETTENEEGTTLTGTGTAVYTLQSQGLAAGLTRISAPEPASLALMGLGLLGLGLGARARRS